MLATIGLGFIGAAVIGLIVAAFTKNERRMWNAALAAAGIATAGLVFLIVSQA